jgi:fibronectin-binding autotransporter adhesin
VLSDDTSVSGKLTKTGPGTLTLSGTGANTYTGATAVNAGTLDLGKVDAVSSSSSLTIANGAGLALNSSSSTVPNLTFAGTGTLSFDAAAGLILTVNGTDGVTNSGAAGSITINITGAAPAAGTYTLIDYSGTLQGAGFSAYTLGSVPAGKNYALNDSGSAVELVVTSNYTWTGAVGSEWSTAAISGSKNWTKDGGAIDYADDLGAIFDSTATSFIVDISGANVSPLSVAFNSGSYTLQGTHTIAGPGSVTVASGATLKLGSSNKLPDGAGAGNVAINGTLDLNGYSDTVNGLTGSGSVDNTAAATTSTLTVGANAGGTFSGALKNTGGTLALTKTGGTDITLSGSNSYNGATTINQGRLFISSTNAFSPDTAVTVNNGAAFFLNATGTYAQSITLNSGANLSQRLAATLSNVTLPSSGSVIFNNDTLATQAFTLASAQTLGGSLNIQVGGSGTAATGAVTLSGALSGSGGSLVKSGTGTLALTGSNTFGGGVTISNGTLESRTTSTTLGSGTATMGGAGSKGATYLTGQPNSNRFVINAPDSGNIVIGANGAGSGFTMSGGITLNGNLTLQTFNNTVPIAPATTKATAILTGGVTGSGNLLLNNNGLAANNITISGSSVNHTGSITLQGTATGDTIISAPIGANVIGITQSSSTSLLVLSGSNSYASNLTINAGTVRISNNSNTANDVSTVSIASGGTLDLTYVGTDKVDKLVINGVDQPAGVYGPSATNIAQIIGTGTLTVGAPEIALEQPANTAIASGGSQDFGSVEVGSNTSLTFTIRNSGDLALNLTGTPAAAISGANEADFTVTANPITPVAAGGSTTFTVQFAPSAATARNATLTIANDDSDEGSFVINLTGTGTVSDPFAAWSGGATFDADANGDGVSNGLAWILGAANVSTNARSLLPTVSTTATHMVFTFKRIQASINASTALSVEVGTTLAAWSTYTVGDSDNVGSSPGVTIVKNSPSAGTDTVTVTVARGADAKKFVRLKAVLTP